LVPQRPRSGRGQRPQDAVLHRGNVAVDEQVRVRPLLADLPAVDHQHPCREIANRLHVGHDGRSLEQFRIRGRDERHHIMQPDPFAPEQLAMGPVGMRQHPPEQEAGP
jgi:hypothetical protein